MQVIPVIDLLDGVAVRGVAGRRETYRPVESCLASSADPLSLTTAFRGQLGLDEIYVADLDAIMHGRPNRAVWRQLAAAEIRLMIDAGLRIAADAAEIFDSGASAVIAGLETIAGPAELQSLCGAFGPDRVVFSLDLKNGRPLGELNAWASLEPFEIAAEAVASGIRSMIVLDLADVGVAAGIGTGPLCGRLRAEFPDLRLIAGGGIRGIAEVQSLKQLGIDGVLIASALHNAGIGRLEIQQLQRG